MTDEKPKRTRKAAVTVTEAKAPAKPRKSRAKPKARAARSTPINWTRVAHLGTTALTGVGGTGPGNAFMAVPDSLAIVGIASLMLKNGDF